MACYAAMDNLNNTDLCKASVIQTGKSYLRNEDLAHPTGDFKIWGNKEMCVCVLSCIGLFVTVAHQAPQSMGFSRQEYWSG